MGRLGKLGSTIPRADISIARLPPKTVDSYYHSADWKALRVACLKRAGFRCEIAGPTCTHRATIADHIVSRRNGGSDDLSNLRAACRACDNRIKETVTGERARGGKA